jgi:hypothetical protein
LIIGIPKLNWTTKRAISISSEESRKSIRVALEMVPESLLKGIMDLLRSTNSPVNRDRPYDYGNRIGLE